MTAPMYVYLAARFSRKGDMQAVAARLEATGDYLVTSRWIDGSHDQTDADCTHDQLAMFAREDIEDIQRSDLFIGFLESPGSGYQSGGRHVEFGYALARDLWIVLIGPPENVFHHIRDEQIMQFDTLDAMLKAF